MENYKNSFEDVDKECQDLIGTYTTDKKQSPLEPAFDTMIVELENDDKYFSTVPAATKIKKDSADIEEADDIWQVTDDGNEIVLATKYQHVGVDKRKKICKKK